MAKSKKKKNQKNLDFQKVKLKIGRRIKRDDNETKAEFSSRKIILKEVKSYSDDPLTALARHSEHISNHGKLTMLNHFNSAFSPGVVKSLNKPILDSLSKFIIDHSHEVRTATIKCLKTCYNHLKNQHLSTREFVFSLKPYLDCAYTHVAKDITSDCHKFLDYFVSHNDHQIFEPLMAIILRRYEVGNLTDSEKNLAIKLRRYYLRHIQKQTFDEKLKSDRLEPLKWTAGNFILDLDFSIHNLNEEQSFNHEREVLLTSVEKRENICEKFLTLVRDEDESDLTRSNVPHQPASKRKKRIE